MTQTKVSPEERALEAVKKRNDGYTDFIVGSVVPRYLGGTLYLFMFKDSNGAGFENYAYVPDDDSQVEVYRNVVQLAHAVSIKSRPASPLERMINAGGMSGVIAILITITICFLTITSTGELQIPDVLSNALTMVLGFYFGSKTSGHRD